MDLTDAVAEPFNRYYPSHESTNANIKLAALSFRVAEPTVQHDFDTNGQTGGVLQQPVEPWGFLWANDIPQLYRDTVFSLCHGSIVQTFSAFEQFLVNTRGELDRWRNANSLAALAGSTNTDDGDISLNNCFSVFGWDSGPISQYRPLFNLFRECRNCIAHRQGTANRKLEEIANGQPMADCNSNWPFSTATDHLPDWPDFSRGQFIKLLPKHVILASTVCFKIAKIINTLTVKELGENGMTFMALHHSLFADDHFYRPEYCKNHQNAATTYLVEQYSVKHVSLQSINATMHELEIHAPAHARHAKVYPNGKLA